MAKAIFGGFDAGSAQHFWITDGTSPGTLELPTLPTPTPGVTLGSRFIYTSGGNLCVTDGTAAGTTILDVHAYGTTPPFGNSPIYPGSLAVAGDKVVFSGLDSSHGPAPSQSQGVG